MKVLDLKYFSLLFLAPLTLIVAMGCQVSPRLADTPNFEEGAGKLFVHQNHKAQQELKIRVDGQPIDDLNRLDEKGLLQPQGKHAMEFQFPGTNNGISEIDYTIQKDKSSHLFYCHTDGSFHWYMTPLNERPLKITKVCK
ncbi:MAG: hypothetical protein AAF203_05585 [Pseudomonadota bacterium]